MIAQVFNADIPSTIDKKRSLLLDNRIAIWDVIHSCDIIGSSDNTIRNVIVNDFSMILENSEVDRIFVNGGKAYELYHKYAEPQTGIKAIKLPSTSPANATWNMDKLVASWRQIL